MPSIVQASASLSTVTASPTSVVDDGVASVTVTLTVLDGSGNPIAGVPASACVLAVTGTGNTVTQPTGATDANGEISGRFVSTVAEAKSASFTLADLAITDTAAATVTAGGVVTFDFQSDWTNSTGATELAVTDGGVWPSLGCPTVWDQVFEVVTAASIGLDTSAVQAYTGNVLRCQFLGADACGMLEKEDAVPISTTHYGQFFIRNDEVGGKNDHPVAYNNLHFSGEIQCVPFTRHANNSNGAVAGQWVSAVGVNGSKCFCPPLTNGTWYRFEWQMEYVTPTSVKMWPRVYNATTGVLLFDAYDFIYPPGGFANLGAAYDGGVTQSIQDAELARDWGMGNEGPGGQPNTGGYYYYAGLRLSQSGWIGGVLT